MVAWVARGGRAGIRFLDVPQSAREQLRAWLSEDVRVGSEPEKLADTEPVAAGSPGDGDSDELDFQAALELIAERAQVITGSSGAAIALGDSSGMVCRASIGEAPDVGVHLRPESGLSGYCLRTGEVVHCNDTQTDPRVDAAAARQLKLGSAIIVPVFALGRLSGLLEVLSPRANAFDERQVARLERFAELLGSAVEENQRGRKFAARSVPEPSSALPETQDPVSSPEAPTPRAAETESRVEAGPLKPVPAAPPSPHFVLDRSPRPPAAPEPGTGPNADPRLSGIPEDALRSLNTAGGAKVWQTCSACGHLNPPWAVQCENCNFSLGSAPEAQPQESLTRPEGIRRSNVAEPVSLASVATEQKLPESSPATLFSRRARALMLGAIILLVLCVLAFFAGRYIGRARLTSKPAAAPTSSALPPEISASPQAASAAVVVVQSATAPASREPATNIDALPSKPDIPNPKADENEALTPVRLMMWPERKVEAPLSDPAETKSRQLEITTALTAVTMPQGTPESAQITAGKLIHRVDPAYPAAARARKVSGVAVLSAIVSKTGTVKEVNLISGPEMLGAEAVKAIRQWRYEPYQVAGQPVDVRTTITVTFLPSRN
jgi:TonB family protein